MATELPPTPGDVPRLGQSQSPLGSPGAGSPAPGDLVYFLHIPKTSGTSLSNFLQQIGGPEGASPVLLWDHLVTGAYSVSEKTRFITGHFGGLLPLWLKRWPKIITMLRDPVARAVSHINEVQRTELHPLHHLAAGLSILRYCEHPVLRRSINNLQSRYLASLSFSLALMPQPHDRTGERGWGSISIQFEDALYALERETGLLDAAVRALAAIDAVGICEAHGPSLQVFARLLGWNGAVAEARLNSTPPAQRDRQSLSETESHALADLNAVDLQVYRHGIRLFLDACQKYAIPLEQQTRERLTAG